MIGFHLGPLTLEEALLDAIILAIVLAAIYAPIGTYRSWRIYFADRRTRIDRTGREVPDRSTILRLLAIISTLVTIALLASSSIALYRLFLGPVPFGGHLLGLVIVLLGTIPFLIDRTMRRIRRVHGDGTPPPFRESD